MSTNAVSTITSKGQVTVPEPIRRRFHLQAGERLEWKVTDAGVIEVRRIGQSLEALTRILPKPSRKRSSAGMDRAVGRHLAGKHRARG